MILGEFLVSIWSIFHISSLLIKISCHCSVDTNPPSGVVSPEQSEDGIPILSSYSSLGPGTYQSMYAEAPAPFFQPSMIAPALNTMHAPVHPAMQALTPQALQAPSILGPPALHPVPTYSPASTHLVTIPPLLNPAANLASGNKRRRVDACMVDTRRPPPGSLVNGHMMPMPLRGRQKSQAQVDRRRERNRILARRTRLRKKFFFESLQKEVTDLQLENTALKEIAKSELPEDESKALLDDCKAMDNLPEGVAEACNEGLDLDSQDFSLIRSVQRSQQCFIITDPSLQDNPIVYASDDFMSLTGYKREEVLGRNCRFLQGTETSTSKVADLRKAISLGEDVTVTMINYTAEGTAFWNKLFIAALRDAHNCIVNFIGVIVKVAQPDPDDPEAGKRLPGEQSTGSGDEEDDDDDADFDESYLAAADSVKSVENTVVAVASSRAHAAS